MADAVAPAVPRKRKSFLAKYASPALFLLFVLAATLGLRHIADSGYFEEKMQRVRFAATNQYLERRARLPNASKLPSGLIFSIERRGYGDRAPGPEDVCEIHYTAHYRFPAVFEDTRTRAYPVQRAPKDMIPGLREALQLMCEGDRWQLVVPYWLAFGEQGDPQRGVPSYMNLRYDVEVVRCPNGVNGYLSKDIDTFLLQFLKQPIPPKTMTTEDYM